MDECTETPDICGDNSNCTNINGSHTCHCHDGYEIFGTRCQGKTYVLCILENEFGCTVGKCMHLYEFHVTYMFSDIDECGNGQAECSTDPNAVCENQPGTYQCSCRNGFELNVTTGLCEGIFLAAITCCNFKDTFL